LVAFGYRETLSRFRAPLHLVLLVRIYGFVFLLLHSTTEFSMLRPQNLLGGLDHIGIYFMRHLHSVLLMYMRNSLV
jgi:hypothetical protein